MLFDIENSEIEICSICNIGNSKSSYDFYYYFPIENRIRAMFLSIFFCNQLKYRSSMNDDTNFIRDWIDGSNYQNMKEKGLFQSCYDLAIGYSTDGLEIKSTSNRNQAKKSCWPELITFLSLPPELRSKLDNVHCLGIIPTTKQGKRQDFESFHQPKIMELKGLLKDGVSVYNCLTKR